MKSAGDHLQAYKDHETAFQSTVLRKLRKTADARYKVSLWFRAVGPFSLLFCGTRSAFDGCPSQENVNNQSCNALNLYEYQDA